MSRESKNYGPLTFQMMEQLAAPHTWPASIFPVLIALALAYGTGGVNGTGEVSSLSAVILLLISVLFQSAVNTINDYFDYVKGTDSIENQPDPTDAVLVYNNVNPKHALVYALALICAAFLLGIYCIAIAGWIPLAIALIGVLVVFLYSGGRTPISYLPIGEVVSGFTLGTLVMLASYQVLTLRFEPLVLLWSIPPFIGIGLIMMTNNCCDIEKDIDANRKTLPVLLGRPRTVKLYHAAIFAWMIAICVIVLAFFVKGWVILPFLLLAAHPLGRQLLANPLIHSTRGPAFGTITSLNICLGTFYAAAIIVSAL